MNVHFSISLKLTIIVVAVSAAVIFSLTFYNINEQSISLENIFVDKAKDTTATLDVLWNNTDSNKTMPDAIQQIKQKNNESIDYIHVFLRKNNTLDLIFSTDQHQYDHQHDAYINYSINSSKMGKISTPSKHPDKITVISPINSSINLTGAYEISFYTDDAYQAFEKRAQNLLLISTLSLFILIFSFLFLLRHTIVTPIIQFRDTARMFGKGNLQKKIQISSKDELGELAFAFNKMAEDLKKSRKKLEEYNKILERLIDQKDAFIGQLGHDLKNPLQPLIGLLPLLIQQEKDPKMKKHLQIMNENAQYMKELIFKTLELAKLRTEKIEFDYKKLNLTDIINRVITTQNLLLEQNNISITTTVEKNIEVYADPLRLEEVFKNLITNAVKYTPDDGGKIHILAQEGKNDIHVIIKDSGVGMTKEQLAKIFDEFYRADSSTHGQDSVGLGLSITKRIIEKHGGSIWAESKGPNKGSAFHFTLPKNKEDLNEKNNGRR